MGTSLDIKIKRANKVYHAGEVLSGVVVISGKDSIQHQGVSLTVEGSVNLQLSAKSVGVFEAFYNSVKPIQIINSTIEMVKPGKFPSGKTEIPFEFPLHVKGNKVLYETYHGVFVNIQYTLRCDMRRSLLAKDLTKTCEFIVHSAPQKGKLTPSPVDFTITPETLQNVKERLPLEGVPWAPSIPTAPCLVPESLAPQIPHQRAPHLHQLCHHAAADRGAGGRELGRRHQEHRAAAGPRGDLRVCRRLRPGRHRDSEHPDRRGGCVSEPVRAHPHGVPPALHLPHAGDHQLQSGI
ncbi:vacuolar protein sorting-associated protein 26C isoform X2 [Meles meles]|uniref:vacuolar protein sorting-associated protein 26C isoform X2 n=1 Tax=Meles meles TaxID=9662 RepID=UPI001E6987B3|nr:vacuolar protein sorting-associated protein 26C isoform X2 [Meles meles]